MCTSRFQKIRVAVLLAILFGVTLLPYRYFWLPPAITEPKTWIDKDGICRQTSSHTCSAASLVTLLRRHGINITEAEAVRLALTNEKTGTWVLGEYRALKMILRRHNKPLRPLVRWVTSRQLLDIPPPAIIGVGLMHQPKTPVEQDLRDKYSWSPGAMHDVVYLGLEPASP